MDAKKEMVKVLWSIVVSRERLAGSFFQEVFSD